MPPQVLSQIDVKKDAVVSRKMAAFVPGLAAALVAASPPSCSITEGYRHRWEANEPPWVLYADQNCPSDRGVVEDSAIWSGLAVQQVSNVSSGAAAGFTRYGRTTHTARKLRGRLGTPLGLMVAGGELLWVEELDNSLQPPQGTLKRCPVDYQTSRCVAEPTVIIGRINCPQDFALDYARGHAYVIQYGGGNSSTASLSCGGEPRITRFDLAAAADGSSRPTDVVTPVTTGLFTPRYLALDPIVGYLFWTDAMRSGGALMRSNLDGSSPLQLMLLLHVSGVAVDTSRKALYVTHAVQGASLLYSSYDGRYQKHVSSQRFFEPRGLAVDPSGMIAPLMSHVALRWIPLV